MLGLGLVFWLSRVSIGVRVSVRIRVRVRFGFRVTGSAEGYTLSLGDGFAIAQLSLVES